MVDGTTSLWSQLFEALLFLSFVVVGRNSFTRRIEIERRDTSTRSSDLLDETRQARPHASLCFS